MVNIFSCVICHSYISSLVNWTSGSSGHAEEWSNPGYILKEVSTGFPATSDVGCERKESRGLQGVCADLVAMT